MIKTKTKSKTPPMGVKVISILYYIGAAFALIGAIMAFAGGGLLATLGGLGALGGIGLGLFFAVIMLAFAVLGFFMGRGLWRGQNWARIVAVIFAALGILGALASLFAGVFTSVVNLAAHLLIGWYLLFHKQSKKFFG